eukprot:gnl/MRDRNA2_/MRDRNA2_403866_c0_seq1.p1 gnl/MRDRNA2_/MRDRNA2_403866_c0~~gnl/MRDRNA2_/MRDRNA2_403866_c0_seq1.p1  ORF type:complete len:183 (+),score=19.76 gnl/MRDRNA2_/MRDRNA2_403866_c0_seq1:24-551(+)
MFDYTPPQRTTEKSIEMLKERPKWNEYVGDQGAVNIHLSPVTRAYFSKFLFDRKDRQKADPPLPHVLPENLRDRPRWNEYVGDQGAVNVHLSAVTRTYFSTFGVTKKDRQNSDPPVPFTLPENLRERPSWNSSVVTISDSNSELSCHTRQYFSKLKDTPIGDKMRKAIELAKAGR